MSAAYLLRRLAAILIVLLIVSLTVFSITQILPGNAAVMILGEYATPAQLQALELKLGLDQPWYVQYWRWFSGMLSGDWGVSMRLSQPVAALIGEAFWRSAALALASLATVTLIAIPLGILAALKRGTIVDLVIGLFAYIGTAVPEFVTATLLLVFLAGPDRGFLPAGGFAPLSEGVGAALSHVVLPAATLSLILTAHIARQVRSEMSDVLSSDYIRAARLKGLSERSVVLRHALRNAMAPAVAVISLDIGYLLGGILVVEEVFAWPGLGRLIIYALQNRDLPVIQAATLVLAFAYALSNLVSDIVIAWLDPRVRYA
ncbi:ABC transporter permease [Bosea psychrotolerans]|uniref:Peptide/nickel transport system permease protein n=1 Tax=Bosea psychrotolerans TaxID=1871628 RepID=A0A2S4LZG1_9HYPH|nr:ABC transporter permease [Bosea psychrotolerans]POR47745.1 peptide/nickel transport system permease protein [Bosea psychrotolerans]